MDMKVGIIGGGSIGLLFGAYLGQSHEVTIFTRRESQAKKILNEGIKLISADGGNQIVEVAAQEGYDDVQNMDFILIAVKQYHLNELMEVFLNIPAKIPVCFIQNGMAHVELLQSLPNKKIFVGTVEHGAKRMNDHTVSHNGIGKTNMAIFKGEALDKNYFPTIENPCFPVHLYDDYKEILVNKLITNALINPLSVIFNVKNGRLVENAYFFEVFKLLFEEIYEIFPLGNKEISFQNAARICETTKHNTSSMLKDIQEGRRTEIDAILGYVLKVAERKGKRLKTAQMVYAMVKGLEQERG